MKKLQNNQIESIVLKDGTIATIEKSGKTHFFGSLLFKKAYRNWVSIFNSKKEAIEIIKQMNKYLCEVAIVKMQVQRKKKYQKINTFHLGLHQSKKKLLN